MYRDFKPWHRGDRDLQNRTPNQGRVSEYTLVHSFATSTAEALKPSVPFAE